MADKHNVKTYWRAHAGGTVKNIRVGSHTSKNPKRK